MTGSKNPGEIARARYIERMQSTCIGAKVARGQLAWTIVERKAFDTSVSLKLRRGRRTLQIIVPVCITGPCWADLGLHPVAAAPLQREMKWS